MKAYKVAESDYDLYQDHGFYLSARKAELKLKELELPYQDAIDSYKKYCLLSNEKQLENNLKPSNDPTKLIQFSPSNYFIEDIEIDEEI